MAAEELARQQRTIEQLMKHYNKTSQPPSRASQSTRCCAESVGGRPAAIARSHGPGRFMQLRPFSLGM